MSPGYMVDKVRPVGWEQFLTLQPHTLFLFPFPLGRGLADQQLDVGHVVGPVGQISTRPNSRNTFKALSTVPT